MKISEKDFDNLYRQYGPMVRRRCLFLLKDEDKAMDALQDTFLNLLEKQTKLSSVCSSLFFTTATRVCLNKIRYDKYRSGPQFETIALIVEDNAAMLQEEITNISLLLDFIFEERDSKDKEIAIYHYVDGFTLEETAKKMKMSVSGIRKRLNALQKYVSKMKEEGEV